VFDSTRVRDRDIDTWCIRKHVRIVCSSSPPLLSRALETCILVLQRNAFGFYHDGNNPRPYFQNCSGATELHLHTSGGMCMSAKKFLLLQNGRAREFWHTAYQIWLKNELEFLNLSIGNQWSQDSLAVKSATEWMNVQKITTLNNKHPRHILQQIMRFGCVVSLPTWGNMASTQKAYLQTLFSTPDTNKKGVVKTKLKMSQKELQDRFALLQTRCYSPKTGKLMPKPLFQAPHYFLLVDKTPLSLSKSRFMGAYDQANRQPSYSASYDGGSKLGYMDVDALIQHGATSVLGMAFQYSDMHTAIVCRQCHLLATTSKKEKIYICTNRACSLERRNAHAGFHEIRLPWAAIRVVNILRFSGCAVRFFTKDVFTNTNKYHRPREVVKKQQRSPILWEQKGSLKDFALTY
jgi:hypothetical protein